MNNLINFLTAGILAATPLLFGVLGETLTEKSGNLNLGVEGMMFMGGIAGIMGPYYYEKAGGTNPYIALLLALVCAVLCAGLGAFIFSVLTITLRANQNVTGLALTMFGTGVANYFGEAIGHADPSGFLSVSTAVKGLFNNPIFPEPLVKLPVVGKLLFSHNFMVYLAILTAVLLAWFLGRTRKGLNLRAVGESPATADAAGINVTRYKYLATCIGGGLTGLGGLYLVMNAGAGVGGAWVHNCINGYGWLAVALVIFAVWSPKRALWCSLIFGGLACMRYYYPISFIPASIYDIVPYIVTAVVLVFVSLKHNRANQPPASLGLSYFREER
ncbi:MAG: ABC transporter permease [Evtepia sp.]|uniref:ABC transporter permease n=1 Tax=Evtepia sp. TaxID=2773933 RepID=UPI002A74CF22|nr:ABC transporter permease [Evtepia sp.]MDY3014325.1 ABC transporter permease [Evtepia sp.]